MVEHKNGYNVSQTYYNSYSMLFCVHTACSELHLWEHLGVDLRLDYHTFATRCIHLYVQLMHGYPCSIWLIAALTA